MNTHQLRVLGDIVSTLNRVTDEGLGHGRRAAEAEQRRLQMEREHLRRMKPQKGMVAMNAYAEFDGDDITPEEQPVVHPFVVSGKVTLEFGQEKGQPQEIVTLALKDGEWEAEFSKPTPKKRAARKPRAVTATPTGTVQGAKGPVDPERQERAKKAAATRAKNRAAKQQES